MKRHQHNLINFQLYHLFKTITIFYRSIIESLCIIGHFKGFSNPKASRRLVVNALRNHSEALIAARVSITSS